MFSGDGNGKIYRMDMSGKVTGMTLTGQDHGDEDTGDLIHSLDCRNPRLVYIGSASMWDVQKLTIKGVKRGRVSRGCNLPGTSLPFPALVPVARSG